nr:MAG TPA: Reovirus sigma C capsid protein [Caudoviricetes sp.]
MASHGEINPSDIDLLLGTSLNALEIANGLLTRRSGDVWIDTGDGKGVLAGAGAADGINRVDEDGNQSPLVDTSGIDKAARDARKAADDAAAKADDAIRQGEQIRRDAQAGIDDARRQAQDAAAKADKARSDLQAEVDANRKAADTAIAAVDAKADKAQSDLESQTTALKEGIANVDAKAEQVKADASKISQRVDADKAALDKSIASVDAKAQAASDKGDQLAGQISDVTTTVNGHTTKLGELSTRIEGVASDGQTTVKSLTSLQQTVTGLSSTVSQNTKTASDAMSKVSQVEQTANGISANLSKNYTTTADADEKYAAKTELKATADGLQANITRSQQTADGAVTAASKAQATADGLGAALSKDYQTTAASDEKYSTKADLKATSDSISSSLSSVRRTADGAVTAASKAQQTADGVSLDLSKNYQSKAQADATYATRTSLKATSDSLSASISSTAKTAQSAVDKATSLEANLNGFKTTVSQTYTTKDDLDKLSVGGTNLIKGTSGNWSDWIVITPNASNFCKVLATVDTPDGLAEGADYTTQIDIEFADVASTGGHAALALTQGTVDGSWSDVFNVFADSLLTRQTPVNAVYHLSRTNKARKSNTANRKFQLGIRCDWFASGKFRWRRIKAEKGSKATDWSPAPEDLQPAGDYSTKSELTQTADSIKTQVAEVSKTASGAMSKATTVEQTANGLSTRITAQGKTLDATTKTANEAKSTADSNKQTISQVKTTADGAVSRVSSLEQNLDGFESTVAKTYQPKDGMSAYATTSALKQTSDSITAQVAEVSKTASGAMSKATTVEQTANGLSTRITEQAKTLGVTVKTANEAKSTADSNKTTISQTSNLVNAALAGDNLITDGGFESTAWWMGLKAPFRLSNGSFYHGAHVLVCEAATGDNRCPLTHAKGMVGTATAITVTKGRTYRLSGYCAWYGSVPSNVNPGGDKLRLAKPDGTCIAAAQCSKSTSWSETHVDWTCPPDGSITSVRIEVVHQANGTILWDDVSFRDITEAAATSNRVASVEQNLNGFKISVADTYQPKSGMGGYATQSQLTQTANQIRGEVSEKYQSKDGMGSYATNSALTQKANEITGKVQEVAKTTQGNTTTISQVSQKADKINTTLSQKIDGKADVSRVSSLEQNLSGFKTTVAQSYQPKGDYPTRSDMQSSVSQTTSSIKSEVANTYTTAAATEALRKGSTRTFTMGGANGKAKWVKLGYLTSNGDSSSVLLHVYSGDGYNGLASQNAEFEIFVKDGWQQSPSATGAFGVSVSRIRDADDVKVKVMALSSTTCDIWAYLPWAYWNGHYTLQGDYKSWQDGPNCGGTRIQDAEPTNGTAQNLAYDTLSTRSYVDQTSQKVALGVVQNYQGSDGSGLATKSDITAAKTSITSTVASTYATKTGVTQEIGSKITQNNNSWEAKFYSKTETDSKVSAVAKTSMTGVRVEYALAASSTTAPTSGWSTTAPAWQSGRYMWQRTVTTLGDGTSKTTAATCITGATGQTGPKGATGSTGPQGPQGATGKQGQTGATGNGAKSITPEYYLSTSATTQTGGSWSPNMAWSSGKYLWTRSKCVWTNGTTTTTTPVLADALNNANQTANQAAGKAQNAQDRVAALEPCIQMTSDGVQVGKKTNGVFTGPSALVGTDGVFHVRNKNPSNRIADVVRLGQDELVVKSKTARSGGDFLDRFIMGPFGDDHFAIRMEPALAGDGSTSSEPEQVWQTGWQDIAPGKGCSVFGHAAYGYRGGCLRFRGRVKTTIDGDNSLFANPGVLRLWTSSLNRNFLLPAYRNNAIGWTNAYIPAGSRQVRIYGVWDWVSLDQLSIAQ